MFSSSNYTQVLADAADSGMDRNDDQEMGSENVTVLSSFRKRLLTKDSKKFRKFVETTNTHGVRQIFIGKSLIRKIFWGLFFLFSMTVCLVNVSRSIQFYISTPTATTVTSRHVPLIQFPAVTVCNMHIFKSSYLELFNLTDLTRATLNLRIKDPTKVTQEFRDQCLAYKQFVDPTITFEEAVLNGGQSIEDFIVECEFLGVPCNFQTDFTPVMTPIGRCFTFNGRNEEGRYKNVSGIGYRHGLELVLNTRQNEFIGTFTHEAGARVVIHNQDDPPTVLENGLAVPIGNTAYMSIRARQIDDRSGTGLSNCHIEEDRPDFAFAPGSDYSLATCLYDCILKDIAEVCDCIHGAPIPEAGHRYSDYQTCSIVQLCCIAASLITTEDCGCTIACNQSLFDITTTYSTYPALRELAGLAQIYNTTQEDIRDSFLSVRVFFSELIKETEITERSYSLTALIADIGGQFGLFLGASIISIMEFLTWIFDEFKDRCFGVTETKMRERIRRIGRKTSDKNDMLKSINSEHDRNGIIAMNPMNNITSNYVAESDETVTT